MNYSVEDSMSRRCPECNFTFMETIDPMDEVCTLCIEEWEQEKKEKEDYKKERQE